MISNDKVEKLNELQKRLEELGAVDVKFATDKSNKDVNKFADDVIAFLQAVVDGNYTRYYSLPSHYEQVFIDGFQSEEDIENEFGISGLSEYRVLIAAYDLSEAYSGDAYVLMLKGGEFYEAHGSHCSCMGLEGQFEPESVPVEALRKRIVDNQYSYGAVSLAKPHIKEILDLIA